MDIRQIVGGNMRRYRLAAGLSQEEVAIRMGVDRAYISGIETGRRNPTVLTLWHAALALNTKPAALLDDSHLAVAGLGKDGEGA
jgi:transcriptional regulator with XRE-family HTH domain